VLIPFRKRQAKELESMWPDISEIPLFPDSDFISKFGINSLILHEKNTLTNRPLQEIISLSHGCQTFHPNVYSISAYHEPLGRLQQ
jgi:hypothetical protein